MSFYKEQKYLQEQPREVRQIKKSLPYTISEIGSKEDHAKWKAEQARRQEIWDSGRADRYAAARQRAVDIIQGVKEAPVDKNAVIERQYNERQAALVKNVCRPETCKPAPKSFIQRMYEKVLDFFLELKF